MRYSVDFKAKVALEALPGELTTTHWSTALDLPAADLVKSRGDFALFQHTRPSRTRTGQGPWKGVTYVLPYDVIELRYYLASDGKSPFETWFAELESAAAAKVAVALARLETGNLSNAKGVGEGVLEYRIDWGPGYRVYFGRDGDTLVILLTGGTKRRQQRDIDTAKALWADYRRRRPRAR